MRVRNRELDRSIVFSRDSEPTSCGSPACHLPLLFICLGISLHSFDSYIRGNPWPWNRVAPTTPPRPTATRFQLVIADRSPVRASVLQDGFIPLPPFPLSSFFFFFAGTSKRETGFPACTPAESPPTRLFLSVTSHGGRGEPLSRSLLADPKINRPPPPPSNIRGDLDFPPRSYRSIKFQMSNEKKKGKKGTSGKEEAGREGGELRN